MKHFLPSLLVVVLVVNSCVKEDPSFDEPEFYNFERNGVSTVDFEGQTIRLKMATEVGNYIKSPDSNLEIAYEMFNNQKESGEDANPFGDPELNISSKSIRSKVATSTDFFSTNSARSKEIQGDFSHWLSKLYSEIYSNKNELAKINAAGQIADGTTVRYVSSKGLEYDQLFSKSLIGGMIVDQMLNHYLSSSVLDAERNQQDQIDGILEENKPYTTMEHKWDEAYGYLFGLSADASRPMLDLGSDNFLNKYLARVDNDQDFTGIALDIFAAFKKGRAAIVANDFAERDIQATIIRKLISKVIAVRSVYYLQSGKNELAVGNYGSAFHDLSEGLGFIYSLQFTRKGDEVSPYISEEKVLNYIEALTEKSGFWTVEGATLDQISLEIATSFGFNVSEAL